jgi:DNA-directed RNA polymerase subunit K/omega
LKHSEREAERLSQKKTKFEKKMKIEHKVAEQAGKEVEAEKIRLENL